MLRVIVPASSELIEIGMVKNMLRIDGDEFDEQLPILITAARETVENQTGLALAVVTYEWSPGNGRTRPFPLLPANLLSNDGEYPIRFKTYIDRIPAALITAIALLVGENIKTVEAATDKALTDTPSFQRLIAPYRRWSI